MDFGWAFLREVVVKALLFGVLSSFTFGLASLLDCLWPLWDSENRALHDIDRRLARDPRVGAPRRPAQAAWLVCGADGISAPSPQTTCSRPGPTPISVIGTPIALGDVAQVVAGGLAGRSLSVRHSVRSSRQPGSSSYSAVAWCSTDWW